MSTAYLQLEIKLVKCNLAIGRQQMHVNAHLDMTDEIDEYLFLKSLILTSLISLQIALGEERGRREEKRENRKEGGRGEL